VGTGLHLVWPYPIEETQAVDLRRSKQVESDSFMFKQSGDVNARISPVLKPGVDGFLLTGDRNIIHAKCLLTYYVDSSNRDSIMNYFIYNAPDQQKILKAILDNAVIKAASMTSAEDILFKTDKFRGQLAKILRKELKEASLGVTFESKDISIKATSPRQTKSAFDAMSQASQQQDTMKSKAEAFRISAEKQARGEADSIISTARSEQIRKVAAAKSDASTFTQRLKQYRKTPDLISRTIYEETMFRIFQNVDEKFVIRQDSKGQIRLLISRSMDKNKKKKK
jgi:membrane protease subunit HflK